MATATGNTNQTYWTLRLEAWEHSYNESTNQSSVKWEIYLDANGGSITSRQLTRTVVVDGVTVVDATEAVTVNSYGSVLLASGTNNISHNADGSKTIVVSASIAKSGTWTNNIGSASCSVTLVLTNIPQASIPSINTWPNNSPSFIIGNTITIHMNRKSTSFLHTVSIIYGGNTRQIGTNVADNVTFDTSVIASALTNLCGATSLSCSVTISVITYSNGTSIGTKTTPGTALLPSASKPALGTATTTDLNSATSALTGSNTKMVKGKSNIRITLSASTSDSATTLDKAVWQVGNAKTTQTLSGTSANLSFDSNNVSVGSISVTVYDKRGRTTKKTVAWTLINYVSPTIALEVARSQSDMTLVTVKVTGNAWSGTFGAANNSVSITYRYRLRGGSSSTASSSVSAPSISNNSYSLTKTLAETFASGSEYEIRATIADSLTTVNSQWITVYQAVPSAAFYDDGVGVFGTLFIKDRNNPTISASLTSAQLSNVLSAIAGLPVIYVTTGQITTQANNGGDLNVSLSPAMSDSNYHVSITLVGNPNGFDKVAYTVTNKTASGFTIHSWNDYSSSVTQNLSICVIKT